MGQWGYMLDRYHDQLRTAHLLLPNNAPACGAKYYMSPGPMEVSESHKCKNCLRIKK